MIKKPKIKAIIFDLGGVVMHGGFEAFINHYCAQCFTPAGKKKIMELERQLNLGEISEHEFYRQMRDELKVHMTQKQMHDIIVKKMTEDAELLDFIPKLKNQKIALFSNTLGHIATEVLKKRHVPVKKLFDKVFLSHKIQMAKPDAGAYQHVLLKLGVKPHEALMVDDRESNIKGAKKIGMQGIVYRNIEQFKKALQRYQIAVGKKDD
jgi:putative hydrolase of the HAD superfamily